MAVLVCLGLGLQACENLGLDLIKCTCAAWGRHICTISRCSRCCVVQLAGAATDLNYNWTARPRGNSEAAGSHYLQWKDPHCCAATAAAGRKSACLVGLEISRTNDNGCYSRSN